MNGISKYCVALACGLVSGCGSVPPGKYVNMANDSSGPYCVTRDFGPFSYELYYRPLEFFAAKQMEDSVYTSADAVTKAYGNGHYFMLRLASNDSVNMNRRVLFNNMASYQDLTRNSMIMYNFKDNVALINGADTLRCLESVMGKNWGMYHDLAFLLVFGKDSTTDLAQYEMKINEFGLNTGSVYFDMDDIRTNPHTLRGFE